MLNETQGWNNNEMFDIDDLNEPLNAAEMATAAPIISTPEVTTTAAKVVSTQVVSNHASVVTTAQITDDEMTKAATLDTLASLKALKAAAEVKGKGKAFMIEPEPPVNPLKKRYYV